MIRSIGCVMLENMALWHSLGKLSYCRGLQRTTNRLTERPTVESADVKLLQPPGSRLPGSFSERNGIFTTKQT